MINNFHFHFLSRFKEFFNFFLNLFTQSLLQIESFNNCVGPQIIELIVKAPYNAWIGLRVMNQSNYIVSFFLEKF